MLQARKFRTSLKRAVSLIALCGMTLVTAGCPEPGPDCSSGSGTLVFQNNTQDSVEISLADTMGDYPSVTLAGQASHEELVPTGVYSVKAVATTSGRTLLDRLFEVGCDAETVVAIEPLPKFNLSVSLSGTGLGTVTSTPVGINCVSGNPTQSCSASFETGTQVTLSAASDGGSSFQGWSGGCTGTATTCVVNVSQAQSVTATFDVVELSAPLVTSVERGQFSQGQVQTLGMNYYIATVGVFPSQNSLNNTGSPYLGQIMLHSSNRVPSGWALCDGSLMNLSQNTALFSVLGTTYGGNGTTNFALPDLRARVPMGVGAISNATPPALVEGTSVVPLVSSIGWGATSQGQVQALGVNYLIAINGAFPMQGGSMNTSGALLGQLMLFAGATAPMGWAFCDGSLLNVATNTALFNLLGTTYGGNGTTNFALPDLRARVPMGAGTLSDPVLPPQTPNQVALITALNRGATAQGQAGVQGIDFYIAHAGVFPASGGSPNSSGPFIGQLMLFAGNFAPAGWTIAHGGLLNIASNTSLFSLMNTTYGGNGSTDFALPDLRARLPMGVSAP